MPVPDYYIPTSALLANVYGSETVKILSYNPGHDGSIVYIRNGQLVASMEAEKGSNYRYSPVSATNVFSFLEVLDEVPDIICSGGWWPRDEFSLFYGQENHTGYLGVSRNDVIVSERRFLGASVRYFSSTHERSHILCAFGMSTLPKGTPCYALVWEGAIGAFYEIDSALNISLISNVLSQPGNRYALIYGLADPSFQKNAHPRFSDAGKLMALTSFATRTAATVEEVKMLRSILGSPYRTVSEFPDLMHSPYYNVGLDDPEFRNFCGILSDKIFDIFYQFAKSNLKKRIPLIIAGGCGLNCDWNTKWRESNLFPEVFVPPVANDSGSAIGTAIDAQFHFSGDPKIEWSVYSGLSFSNKEYFDSDQYEIFDATPQLIADMLANDLIFGWVNEKYEIGPRALGNRSILAAPFKESTRVRLNEIKQREQFRPIAPVCLEEEARKWFDCEKPSPFMLYTFRSKTDALAAVTHVNGTSRIQTVSSFSNRNLYDLLIEFKARTGFGVLCNTSLNFNGRGFINSINELSDYVVRNKMDGFVVDGKAYVLKSSKLFQAYKLLSK